MTHSFLYEGANHPSYENYLTWEPPLWLRVGLELISNHVERYILFVVDESPHPIQSLKSLLPSLHSQWLFLANPSPKNLFGSLFGQWPLAIAIGNEMNQQGSN